MSIVCMREEHELYYNVEDFYYTKLSHAGQWNMPIQHPFQATLIACFFSGTILVPILYGMIYRWIIYVKDQSLMQQ